jgi:hypothetical protein
MTNLLKADKHLNKPQEDKHKVEARNSTSSKQLLEKINEKLENLKHSMDQVEKEFQLSNY